MSKSPQPTTWIGIIRHWVPKELQEAAVEEYVFSLNEDVKTHIAKAIDEVERRYVTVWTGEEIEPDWRGDWQEIGKAAAIKRNEQSEACKAFIALRQELGIKPTHTKTF